jgi:PTH1 family peptidyl-tRNA hydrolase
LRCDQSEIIDESEAVKLVVGLGNPGSRYEETRHNIGFQVVDALVRDYHVTTVEKPIFHGILYKTPRLLLLKPTTFMNASGKSVLAVKQYFNIELDDIIVIHDDIDLPFGAIRFKRGGGHGGHNGLKSIDSAIGRAYVRVRLGVDKPTIKSQVADYVLAPFTQEERKVLPDLITYAKEAVEALLRYSLDEVKTHYSRKSIEAIRS